jgi:hypothetical protein
MIIKKNKKKSRDRYKLIYLISQHETPRSAASTGVDNIHQQLFKFKY